MVCLQNYVYLNYFFLILTKLYIFKSLLYLQNADIF